MFSSFEEMFTFYTRRRIFDYHDHALLAQGVVHDNDTFLDKIVYPKYHLGRINWGDVLRITAIIL